MLSSISNNDESSQKELVFFKTAFCVMDLKTTKIVFENFYRNEEIILDIPKLEEILYMNVYSGLMQSCDNTVFDLLYPWLDKIYKQGFVDDETLRKLEGEAPTLRLKPEFGPPVKPPPLTCYRPYLSTIAQGIETLQGIMSFTHDDGINKICLSIPKARNEISLNTDN